MKIIETHPREIGFVLWGHCQNLLDDLCMHSHWNHFNDAVLISDKYSYQYFEQKWGNVKYG